MKTEIKDRVKRIYALEKEVDELRHYLFVIDPMKQIKMGIGNDIQLYMKIETSRKFSISASRRIGMGHQESKIEIPNSLLEKYHALAHEQLAIIEQQLTDLVMGKEASGV